MEHKTHYKTFHRTTLLKLYLYLNVHRTLTMHNTDICTQSTPKTLISKARYAHAAKLAGERVPAVSTAPSRVQIYDGRPGRVKTLASRHLVFQIQTPGNLNLRRTKG